MNHKNRTKAIAERQSPPDPPSRWRRTGPEPLGGGPLASETAKAKAGARRAERRRRQRKTASSAQAAAAKRKAAARRFAEVGRIYWISPKAESRSCSHCHGATAAAIRPSDQKAACPECIERLGINARESSTARAWAGVTVRHLETPADDADAECGC